MTVAHFHEHLLGGGILSRLGLLGLSVDFEMSKKHLAHLCRRCCVELHTSQLMALTVESLNLFC